MSVGRDFIFNNYRTERVLQQNAYSCTELVMQDGIPYVRKTINSTGLPYGALKSIAHPCLPHIFYAVEAEGKTYVIEEYISGRTLKECLEQGTAFTPEQQKNIARQLCNVLELLHAKGILHRDIKPSNIIVMHDLQQVKLIDFGIGRSFAHDSEVESQDTCIMGTPGYAPPEQYGFSTTDQRSDIYALGKTLLKLRTDSSDPDFIKVLQRCIEFDPAKRYQSVKELRQALSEPDKGHVLQLLACGLIVLAALTAGYYLTSTMPRAQDKATQTQPVQSQPAQNQAEQFQPVQSQPVQSQPAQNQAEQSQPVQSQPVQAKQAPRSNTTATIKLSKEHDKLLKELLLLGKVKLRQVGHELWFSKNSLQVVDAKENIFCFKSLAGKPPLITVENTSDYPAVNPELKLELFTLGIRGNDFTYKINSNHMEKVTFSKKDKLGVARRVSIQLEGTIPPHSSYTFSALKKVKDFYIYHKSDHGTILGELRCTNMVPINVGYTFELK